MPLHPAAPEDLPGLVAAFAQTVRAVLDLGRSCSDSDFRKDTACPGWTVKDQIAHVVGVEQWLAGSALPRVKVPDYDHVRSDFDRVTEAMIELRRPMIGSKVVDELEGVLATRLRQLGDPELTLDTEIKGHSGRARRATCFGPASWTSGPTSRTSGRRWAAPATSTLPAPRSSWTSCSRPCRSWWPGMPASSPGTS